MPENNLNREIVSHPIDNYEAPKMLNRFAAAVVDLALYILLSFIILTISGYIASRDGSEYSAANALINEQVKYSKLSKYEEKNGYVTYTSSDMLLLEENEPLIVRRVSYFYLSYLTGENLDENYQASLSKDDYIKVDGINYLPKEYYTAQYFNEKILKINDEKSGQKYFKLVDNDENKIAVIDESFIEEVVSGETMIKRLKNDSGLVSHLHSIYQDAIKVFYAQKAVVSANNTINRINTILMFASTIPSFLVFYVPVPLFSAFGSTLGKRFLGVAVVTDKGYLVKKWQLLLRSIPILGATIYICLINSLYFQLLLPLLLLLISSGLVVFNSRRRALHDFMAGTTVIKMTKNLIVYPDEEHYEQAKEIMKKRDEANRG